MGEEGGRGGWECRWERRMEEGGSVGERGGGWECRWRGGGWECRWERRRVGEEVGEEEGG